MTKLLDTHCHLDGYDDPMAVLSDAAASAVRIIAVSEDPGHYEVLHTWFGGRSDVEVALGLHPLRAHTMTAQDLASFAYLLSNASWIGEVGLDFSRAGVATRRQQQEVFDSLLAGAQLGSKPITVHSRGAEAETVRRLTDAGVRAILHWYTGPLAVADEALAAGFSFSVNPVMIASNRGRALLRRIPSERVLLETDGPFARLDGRPARASDLTWTVERLGELWQCSGDEARDHIITNQHNLLADEIT
jgi:TatD DNase family protein